MKAKLKKKRVIKAMAVICAVATLSSITAYAAGGEYQTSGTSVSTGTVTLATGYKGYSQLNRYHRKAVGFQEITTGSTATTGGAVQFVYYFTNSNGVYKQAVKNNSEPKELRGECTVTARVASDTRVNSEGYKGVQSTFTAYLGERTDFLMTK